jgi:hypothetical protein
MVFDNITTGVAIYMLPLVRIVVSYGVRLSLYRQVLPTLSPLSQLASSSQFFHMIITEKGKRGTDAT